jgi:hypothetical protein
MSFRSVPVSTSSWCVPLITTAAKAVVARASVARAAIAPSMYRAFFI